MQYTYKTFRLYIGVALINIALINILIHVYIIISDQLLK